MRELIIAGFGGENNSAGALVERLNADCRKIILPTDFEKAKSVLFSEMEREFTACVILLDQRQNICGKIAVERSAKANGECRFTRMDVCTVRRLLNEGGCNAYLSRGCGNGVGNALYAELLDTNVNCVFLHVPGTENLRDINAALKAIDYLAENIAAVPALL